MAPRTGPRGVTNQDVANRAGVSYVDTSSRQAPIDQGALLSYLVGPQAPGYGMKYGGFPTAAYGESAIEGQAFAIADLARQAAQQAAVREQELQALTENQIANVRSQAGRQDRQFRRMTRMDQTPQQRREEIRALEQPFYKQYETAIAKEVEPLRRVAESFQTLTPSQLAQQIAVSRYGYDPMLASGLFGGQTDLDYATQLQGLQQAQLREQGFDTSLSTDEILARSGITPEEFQAYQVSKANRALSNALEPDYSDQDVALFDVYGTTPSNESERAIMLDPDFATLVENSKLTMLESDKAINPNAVIATIARNYLQNGGNPAYAIMLEDILSRFSFLVEPLGANLTSETIRDTVL